MLGHRDEYGHYKEMPNVIQLSEYIEPEPSCSGTPRQIDPLYLYDTRVERDDYIRRLRNHYELSGSLKFS